MTVKRGMVVEGFGDNNLRNLPTILADVVDQIPEGETFDLVAGPVCAEGYVWWPVDYNGVTGWTAEGEGDTYWLEPIYEDAAVTD